MGPRTPRLINVSTWLFQTFSPLQSPLSILHKILLPSRKKKKKTKIKLEELLHLHTITTLCLSFEPRSWPGSRPSHLPKKSTPEMTSFTPQSPVSHSPGLCPLLFSMLNSLTTRKASWAHSPACQPNHSLFKSEEWPFYIQDSCCWGLSFASDPVERFLFFKIFHFPDLGHSASHCGTHN